MGENTPNEQRVRSVKDKGMTATGGTEDLAASGGFRAQHLQQGEEKHRICLLRSRFASSGSRRIPAEITLLPDPCCSSTFPREFFSLCWKRPGDPSWRSSTHFAPKQYSEF